MRWSNLSTEVDERARLPGYRDEAVVRHFEAPDAVRTQFYEVQAKSILNRVPASSRMPFRWTINPYRGCSHACGYCLSGDSRVLRADGRETPLRELEVGDGIYGTRREGSFRRFAETEVLAKWSSIKPAFRVELEDGTELLASEEHRFLSQRGWEHVSGEEQGRLRRPHLTVGSKLMGPGGSAASPVHDEDYRRGYLCAMIRGDGAPGRKRYRRQRRPSCDAYHFRLALADTEAMARVSDFLVRSPVRTSEFAFQLASAGASHRAIDAIASQSRASSERVAELIAWPRLPRLSWARGFLAGAFDAGGSCSRGALRISSTDEEIIAWTVACLGRFGLECVVERRLEAAPAVGLLGGLETRMRFFLGTDPATTRRRSIAGTPLEPDAPLRVVSIAPLGTAMRMYDITTGTGDFIANGVVSHNCFARPTHRYLGFDAGRDFEREIVVKVNAPELLRAQLVRPAWRGEHVALGTNTDPYQWVEGRYELMPGIWEAMRDAANPCSVLTKSPLLLRDLPLMREIAARTEFSAALSVPTLDERAWRATEPHTPSPRARLEAVAELTRAGIRTGVLIAPLMPGINDAPGQVAPILELASEAGAAYVTGVALHLRGEVRELFFEWLLAQRPELVPAYEALYRRGAYMPLDERKRLSQLVSGPDRTPGERMRGRATGDARGDEASPGSGARRPRRPEQQRLF